jgi:hypothetical protein
MIYWDEPPAVDMHAVATDDCIVETLRLGRTPANGGPLVTLLARWRDMCRAADPSRAA